MPMKKEVLAQTLWNTLGPPVDGNGKPLPPTDEIKAYAEGYIAMLKAGIVSAIPNTVQGTAPPGGPLSAGEANGSKILALSGSVMAAIVTPVNPVAAAGLKLEADAIGLYIQGAAIVSFQTGAITGQSTETGGGPGPLVNGAGAPVGRVSNMDGASMKELVSTATAGVATGPDQEDFYSALVDYTIENATVEFKANTIIGTMSGGQLTLGAGSGGLIT